MPEILQKFTSEKTAALARAIVITVSTLASVSLPILGWMSHEAYLAFARMAEQVQRIDVILAGYEELRKARDIQNAAQDKMLFDHEQRLIRVEMNYTLRGPLMMRPHAP